MNKEEILTEIEKKSNAIIKLGSKINRISKNLTVFDMYLIGILNRTVNINKGFVTLMKDKNFIAGSPLVRLNLDSLLRLYASNISEFDRETFALKVMGGEKIDKINSYLGKKQKLKDKFLVDELSKVEDMSWVSYVYSAGNSFIHYSNNLMRSSRKILNKEERTIGLTIGFHDEFIPEAEKEGAIIWMDSIYV
jgi:hypothetical protein